MSSEGFGTHSSLRDLAQNRLDFSQILHFRRKPSKTVKTPEMAKNGKIQSTDCVKSHTSGGEQENAFSAKKLASSPTQFSPISTFETRNPEFRSRISPEVRFETDSVGFTSIPTGNRPEIYRRFRRISQKTAVPWHLTRGLLNRSP